MRVKNEEQFDFSRKTEALLINTNVESDVVSLRYPSLPGYFFPKEYQYLPTQLWLGLISIFINHPPQGSTLIALRHTAFIFTHGVGEWHFSGAQGVLWVAPWG